MEKRDTGRSLSLAVSSFIFIYHLTTAYLCTYLPSDPLYVSISVSGYAWYGCVLSLLGVAGSVKKSPTLLTIFSNHLLIDTILSLVPKLGMLYLFYDLTSDLCLGSLSFNFWLPAEDTSIHGPGRVMLSSDSNDAQHWAEAMASRRNCEHGVAIAQGALLAILVMWTVSQWWLGLYIRRYAVRMDHKHRETQSADSTFDVEKAFYEEDSLADGYQDAVKSVQGWTWNGSEKEPVIEFIEKAPQKN